MLNRAYTTWEIKSVDEDARVITGVASTIHSDRQDDVMEPGGAKFTLPLPLLWQHRHQEPIGEVFAAEVKADGIHIKARIATIPEPSGLKNRVDDAWLAIKNKLVRGLSVGWRPLKADPIKGSFGLHVKSWDWLELSAVTVPANVDASILTIKSIDAEILAALGRESAEHVKTPGVAGLPVVRIQSGRQDVKTMKPISDQIVALEATRQTKTSDLEAIQTKASDEGRTKDAGEREAFDALKAEIAGLDAEIVDLRGLETMAKAAARPVIGTTPATASQSRGFEAPVIRVTPNEAPGMGFTRAVMCKAASFLAITKDGQMKSALDFAKERYPDNDRLHLYLKATIDAGTTTGVTWAAPLAYATNLVEEFVDFLRPQTIIGKFGTNGIPALTRVPFNIRVGRQTSGGDAYWVGQGAPKPLTKFDFDTVTLGIAKVAAISVITEELARISSPSAELKVRNGLAGAVTQRIDTDFVDPAQAAVSNVNPASITNGLTAMTPTGTSADAARTDMARIIKQFLENNLDPSGLVILMPTALALSLSIQRNSLGQSEFPSLTMAGGNLVGLPVITSQYLANQSGSGNLVIAVDAGAIFLADDGQVTVDVSREASLQMLDNPTNASSPATPTTMVSMFQTNSLAIRAERFINWTKARSTAVVYMDDVNWGTIGSPA